MLERRGFLAGLAAALCAPAIIRTPGLIMPVKVLKTEQYGRSVALMALPDMRMIQEMAFLEGMSQQIVASFWYGDANGQLNGVFDGFVPENAPLLIAALPA